MSQEIRSMNALYEILDDNNYLNKLILPLSCVIDYMGARLYACTLLPVNNDTLVYGSSDAAMNIKTGENDQELLEIIDIVATGLKSNPHPVSERSTGIVKEMKLCVDFEIHKLKDTYFALDFARLLPSNSKKYNLSYMLRHEILANERIKPLSSDTYSGFGTIDKHTYERDLEGVIKWIIESHIPVICFTYLSNSNHTFVHDIKGSLHSYGINLRFMGAVRNFCINGGDDYQVAAQGLLREMILRSVKTEIQRRIRNIMNKSAIFMAGDVYSEIHDFFNSCVQNKDSRFWKNDIKHIITLKYGKSALLDEETSLQNSLYIHITTTEIENYLMIKLEGVDRRLLHNYEFVAKVNEMKYITDSVHYSNLIVVKQLSENYPSFENFVSNDTILLNEMLILMKQTKNNSFKLKLLQDFIETDDSSLIIKALYTVETDSITEKYIEILIGYMIKLMDEEYTSNHYEIFKVIMNILSRNSIIEVKRKYPNLEFILEMIKIVDVNHSEQLVDLNRTEQFQAQLESIALSICIITTSILEQSDKILQIDNIFLNEVVSMLLKSNLLSIRYNTMVIISLIFKNTSDKEVLDLAGRLLQHCSKEPSIAILKQLSYRYAELILKSEDLFRKYLDGFLVLWKNPHASRHALLRLVQVFNRDYLCQEIMNVFDNQMFIEFSEQEPILFHLFLGQCSSYGISFPDKLPVVDFVGHMIVNYPDQYTFLFLSVYVIEYPLFCKEIHKYVIQLLNLHRFSKSMRSLLIQSSTKLMREYVLEFYGKYKLDANKNTDLRISTINMIRPDTDIYFETSNTDNSEIGIMQIGPIHIEKGNNKTHYFEIYISKLETTQSLGLGFCCSEIKNKFPGWDQDTIGYHSDDGKIFIGTGKGIHLPRCTTYGKDDVIGCGIIEDTSTVIFTKNGLLVSLVEGYDLEKYYFTVSNNKCGSGSISYYINVGNDTFMWNGDLGV
eukprot:TRINITY_DN7735_c0_g1_i2.p1 TRINITY_DN7735_c0_g1~~TRINITY_DN7735_c0_g1_i2.p1  ORF type:complete len:954 (-),score=172.68 TRINITY_DN7735_c0_g1_i2:62-2923(-)